MGNGLMKKENQLQVMRGWKKQIGGDRPQSSKVLTRENAAQIAGSMGFGVK